MRILITGGAGFIGSALIRHILRFTNHTIMNLDKLTYASNPANLTEVLPNSRYNFVCADICDPGALSEIFAQFNPDVVMNLAAETHVDRSIGGPGIFVQTNIVGTYTLLEAARHHFSSMAASRQSLFRFHHISTDEVFGTLGDTGHFTEESPYAPNSPYSASKASSDMLVRAWHRTFGLPVVVSNCSNNFGPYQFPEKLIPVVIIAALEGRSIPVYGAGTNIRDWLYVDDHADALLKVLERGTVGSRYNVGGDTEVRNIDLVHSLCEILDELLPNSPHRPHKSLISFVRDRPGHDQRYAISIEKITGELGWTSRTEFHSALRQTVRWYIENKAWWAPLLNRTAGVPHGNVHESVQL
jgi:dTDP-glucose 4,6-dehydratase